MLTGLSPPGDREVHVVADQANERSGARHSSAGMRRSPAYVHLLLECFALKIRSSGMQGGALVRHLLSFSVKKCTDHVLHYSVGYPQGERPCSSPGSLVARRGSGWVWLSGRLTFTLRCLCVTSGRALLHLAEGCISP